MAHAKYDSSRQGLKYPLNHQPESSSLSSWPVTPTTKAVQWVFFSPPNISLKDWLTFEDFTYVSFSVSSKFKINSTKRKVQQMYEQRKAIFKVHWKIPRSGPNFIALLKHKKQLNTNIMLNRKRLPVKMPFHNQRLWLASCLSFPSRNWLSIIICLSSSMKLGPSGRLIPVRMSKLDCLLFGYHWWSFLQLHTPHQMVMVFLLSCQLCA